jgi:hypothetical protein
MVRSRLIQDEQLKAGWRRLAELLRGVDQDADVLENKYGLGSVTVAPSGPKAKNLNPVAGVKFSDIRKRIAQAFRWYERLSFYMTPEGKNYLRSVVEVRSEGTGVDTKIHLAPHKFHENINPIPLSKLEWSYAHYLRWVEERATANQDPLDYIVDYLLERFGAPDVRLPNPNTPARLSVTEDLCGSLLVRVRTHVAADENYPTAGEPRMWTFQVRVAQGSEYSERTRWSSLVTAEHAIGLPRLRVVDSPVMPTRGIGTDFTKGTLYAMDGPSRMYCYPVIGKTFHSALMSGEPVTAAGIIVVENGRMVAVDNRSGHYRPGYMQLKVAFEYLQTIQLLLPDAFVSLFLDDEDAMYFTPQDFIQAANSGLSYPVVAQKLAGLARLFGQKLPVAPKYSDLIPVVLKRFPSVGCELSKLFSIPGASLDDIVTDLVGLLRAQSGTWQTGGVGRSAVQSAPPAPSAYSTMVTSTEHRLTAGGAYCELIPLLDQLIQTRQLAPRATQGADLAHGHYLAIKTRLQNLRPNTTIRV